MARALRSLTFRKWSGLLMVALVLAGCQLLGLDGNDRFSLSGTAWEMVRVEVNGEVAETVEKGDYLIQFLEDGNVSGTDLCNSCGGTYQVGGDDQLSISAGCTEIACPRMQLYVYSRFPYDAASFTIEKGDLRIATLDGDRVYVYERVVTNLSQPE